jgi:hypothetical protein
VLAAATFTPLAHADPVSDVDDLTVLPADSSGLDLALSFDGVSLISDGDATASSVPGDLGLAVAVGADATASSSYLRLFVAQSM